MNRQDNSVIQYLLHEMKTLVPILIVLILPGEPNNIFVKMWNENVTCGNELTLNTVAFLSYELFKKTL